MPDEKSLRKVESRLTELTRVRLKRVTAEAAARFHAVTPEGRSRASHEFLRTVFDARAEAFREVASTEELLACLPLLTEEVSELVSDANNEVLSSLESKWQAAAWRDEEKRLLQHDPTEFRALCALSGKPERAEGYIASGRSLDDVRAELIDEEAREDEEIGEINSPPLGWRNARSPEESPTSADKAEAEVLSADPVAPAQESASRTVEANTKMPKPTGEQIEDLLRGKDRLTYRTAAEALGVGDRQIRNLVRAGSLETVGSGQNKSVTVQSVRQYLGLQQKNGTDRN